MTTYTKYAAVALDLGFNKLLDYGIEEKDLALALPASVVEVPVRGFLRKGYIVKLKSKPDFSPVLPIHRVLFPLGDDLLKLISWMSRYYFVPFKKLFQAALPPIVRKKGKEKEQFFVTRKKSREELIALCISIREKNPAKAALLEVMLQVEKGLFLSELLAQSGKGQGAVTALVKEGALNLEKVVVDRSLLTHAEYFKTKPKVLNPSQNSALQAICKTLEATEFKTHLLFGITGSGKTEVYLQAIERALALGKSALVLVPEITLTTQLLERFLSRFDEPLAVWHSALSDGERFDTFQKIKRGDIRIVIGARSAVFCPLHNLGLIIVDEEHEASYKQSEEPPFYHARDTAIMRGKITAATVVLGSATPSLESFYNAKSGKYALSCLMSRAENSSLPSIRIVDMRKEFDKRKGFTNFSDVLLESIEKRLKNGEQTLLFLNRRGYHTSMLCLSCNSPIKCIHCDLSLTFYKNKPDLVCNLCGFKVPLPKKCPSCKGEAPFKFKGVGTEQIERSLHAVFPSVRTIRLDSDTTKHKGSHEKLLKAFGSGKADVLIGTQMIAKGLHFPEVTLVGILNSDSSLNIPDFRASETTFQLMMQVAGRAGRGMLKGEVVIQTFLPENPVIHLAANQNFEKFYEEEIETRRTFHYPPFSSMVKLIFSGLDEQEVLGVAERLREELEEALKGAFPPEHFIVHPVTAAGHAKVKDRYTFQFLVRLMKGGEGSGEYIIKFNTIFSLILKDKNKNLPPSVKVNLDVNPLSTFF